MRAETYRIAEQILFEELQVFHEHTTSPGELSAGNVTGKKGGGGSIRGLLGLCPTTGIGEGGGLPCSFGTGTLGPGV